MGFISRVKKISKPFIDYRRWMDLDRLKFTYKGLRKTLRGFFILKKPEKVEEFGDAVQRLQLSQKVLDQKKQALLRLTWFMIFVTFGVITYGAYLLYYGHFRGLIVAFAVMLVSLALTFRYHFWYFQVKQKKLGCSFLEWLMVGILGRKS